MNEYLTLIKNPRKFFRSVTKEDISTTLKKTIPIILILYIIQSTLNYFVYKEVYSKITFPVIGNNILIFNLILGVIFLPFAIIISASLLHLSLKILKIKSIFSQNIKILIYPLIPLYLISIAQHMINLIIKNLYFQIALYFIAIVGLFVWSIILAVKGISEFYKISTGRAVGAYFLQFGLIIGAILVIFILILLLILVIVFIFKGFK